MYRTVFTTQRYVKLINILPPLESICPKLVVSDKKFSRSHFFSKCLYVIMTFVGRFGWLFFPWNSVSKDSDNKYSVMQNDCFIKNDQCHLENRLGYFSFEFQLCPLLLIITFVYNNLIYKVITWLTLAKYIPPNCFHLLNEWFHISVTEIIPAGILTMEFNMELVYGNVNFGSDDQRSRCPLNWMDRW